MSVAAGRSDEADRTGSPRDILRRASAVPPRSSFPLLGELTAAFEALRERHHGLIRATRIGTSRLGE
ncbi:MAG: hypothetical protein LBK72_06170, partial [Bifidobacteriaceae bacterium]|nr:hypothetical protein [Bifidobacteriaceae bacterium]